MKHDKEVNDGCAVRSLVRIFIILFILSFTVFACSRYFKITSDTKRSVEWETRDTL